MPSEKTNRQVRKDINGRYIKACEELKSYIKKNIESASFFRRLKLAAKITAGKMTLDDLLK